MIISLRQFSTAHSFFAEFKDELSFKVIFNDVKLFDVHCTETHLNH